MPCSFLVIPRGEQRREGHAWGPNIPIFWSKCQQARCCRGGGMELGEPWEQALLFALFVLVFPKLPGRASPQPPCPVLPCTPSLFAVGSRSSQQTRLPGGTSMETVSFKALL